MMTTMKAFFILLFLRFTKSQDCSKAPNPGVKAICLQIASWDQQSKNVVQPPAAPMGGAPLSQNPFEFTTDVTVCQNITCVCNANAGSGDENCILPDGTPYTKIIRKEIRQMTDDEFSNYVKAMWAVKQNGDYQDLSLIHSSVNTSPGAHSGPSFMPWHREFLKRLEMSLRKIDATVYIPYWDSTIDQRLPNPADSCLWHTDLFGSEDADGQVRNGIFANWTSMDGKRFTRRKRGAAGALFTPNDLIAVLNQTTVVQVLANTAPRQNCPQRPSWNVLEYIHGNPHIWVGGDMVNLTISTNDPMFFCHHSFVDFVWEKWRLAKQTRAARETAYPSDNLNCHREAHNRDTPMRPFLPFNNIDGCSNQYTDSLYSYAPQPTCSATNTDGCNSKFVETLILKVLFRFLFCDLSNGTPGCASKIVLGRSCQNFTNNEDCCYKGVCVNGICSVPTTPAPTTAQPSTNCFNSDVCCARWASRGECQRNVNYMNTNCPASCGRCNPSYDLTTECSDRSPRCPQWADQGACDDSEDWMRENCRLSCDFCDTTRAQDCGGVTTTTPTTTTTTTQPPPITCLNNNFCCQVYSRSTCSDPDFSNYMRNNCAATCGYCTPPRNWNQCVDLLPSCRSWAANGFCRTSAPYMLENCKVSCDSCYFLNRNSRMDACNRNSSRARSLVSHLRRFSAFQEDLKVPHSVQKLWSKSNPQTVLASKKATSRNKIMPLNVKAQMRHSHTKHKGSGII